jgi:predicted metal-dependent hydrolase
MDSPTPSYDLRYLAGIVLFNRGDYFEAHEVWEALWMDTAGPDKRFYQGLIQAAVGLCHFCNGNVRGAVKLYHSSRDYMARYPSPHLGLDVHAFWERMARCFAALLAGPDPDRRITPEEDLLPELTLEPPPPAWPDPAAFLADEEEGGHA